MAARQRNTQEIWPATLFSITTTALTAAQWSTARAMTPRSMDHLLSMTASWHLHSTPSISPPPQLKHNSPWSINIHQLYTAIHSFNRFHAMNHPQEFNMFHCYAAFDVNRFTDRCLLSFHEWDIHLDFGVRMSQCFTRLLISFSEKSGNVNCVIIYLTFW